MKFIRYGYLYFESLICSLLLFTVSVILLIISTKLFFWISCFGFLGGIIVLRRSYLLKQEFIIVADNEILCKKNGSEIWRLERQQINTIKKLSIYRNPGVTLMLSSEAEKESNPTESISFYRFQLTPSAKKALTTFQFLPE